MYQGFGVICIYAFYGAIFHVLNAMDKSNGGFVCPVVVLAHDLFFNQIVILMAPVPVDQRVDLRLVIWH